MSIRLKMVLVVLPLLVVVLIIGGVSSYFIATSSVTRVTLEFFNFKTSELEKYSNSQWQLLADNGLANRPEMVKAAQAAVEVYARSILNSDTELIFAIDGENRVAMSTADLTLTPQDQRRLAAHAAIGDRQLFDGSIGGVNRVAMGFPFQPFNWYVLVTQERSAYYSDVNRITFQTLYLIAGGSIISIALLLLFVRYINRPLSRVVGAMRTIIESSDLSARVPVAYRDEIGQMSHTFNIMIGELQSAYDRIKRYAFDAVVSQKKETKIRNIFQKYVPQELIDRFFAHPESMLVGENRELSVLFSDIRSFTTISEMLSPDELVNSLNRYFSVMVDIIMNRNGIVDKYIGDAIMAFFGAPVRHDDDALQSVRAGIEMVHALNEFNEVQSREGKPQFHIGVGINFGIVTVGNIGTDRKMDYTVIGDTVNVASRLEGLTKTYHQQVLVSESVVPQLDQSIACRLVDKVAVKGKTKGLRIFGVDAGVDEAVRETWQMHNEAMEAYFRREFESAEHAFETIAGRLPDDFLAGMMRERCAAYRKTPPPGEWDGVEIMLTK
ncbi:adenylate/guanylate cyclase domain-containing protein [Salinispira pacifica]